MAEDIIARADTSRVSRIQPELLLAFDETEFASRRKL
jgi:hypothetical protein